MELQAFKDRLTQLLMAHKLDAFFKEVDENLAKRSDLQTFYGLLRARHSRLRIAIGQGTEEKSDAELEMNRINKGLSDFIDMLEIAHVKKEESKDSLDAILAEIEEQKKLLEDSVQGNSSRLVRIGQSLIKLGKTIAEPPPPESGIPYAIYMELGLKKAARRMKIGYAELEQSYGLLLDSFRKINSAHKDLVNYLDVPEEELDPEDISQIKSVSVNLRGTVVNLANIEFERKEFDAVITMADGLLDKQSEIPEELGFVLTYMQEMKDKSLQIKSFMVEFVLEINGLIESFKEIFVELELNLQEQGEEV
ncbi:MAG: hypothetical protein AAFR87_00055 [Bacteroidota bacterium]